MAKPSYTTDQAGAQITRANAEWGTTLGQPAGPISYAFRILDGTGGNTEFTSTQIDAATLALGLWSDVANISFSRVGSGDTGANAYSNNATILYSNYSSPGDSSAAYELGFASPGGTAASDSTGDVFYNTGDTGDDADFSIGRRGFEILVHETGHALGLQHPGDYNATDGTPPTYPDDATYAQDDVQYTLMSYFGGDNTGAQLGDPNDGHYVAASTPLLDDIAAAQRLYGANMTTRVGDTTYGFNSNADRAPFHITGDAQKVHFAIWDAGGTDTLDFSGYGETQTISLIANTFSSVGGLTYNVAIAEHVTIENAVGGSGNDTITGNSVDNYLIGNAGDDYLYGGTGSDALVGGAGNDILIGGTGNDRMEGDAGDDSYSVDDPGDKVFEAVGGGYDTVTTTISLTLADNQEIERLRAAPGNESVSLTGNLYTREIDGAFGNDVLDQGDGSAALHGGAGNDVYYTHHSSSVYEAAGGGVDTVITTTDFSMLAGQEIEYLYAGTDSGLFLHGNEFANTIVGGTGNDELTGAGGGDTLIGGNGDDSYQIVAFNDKIVESQGGGNDTAIAFVSYTLGAGQEVETLEAGTNAGLTLTGNAIANTIIGGGGNDTLDGAAGADVMQGGAGNDLYYVDDSGDQVIEQAGGGTDTVLTTVSFALGAGQAVETLAAYGGASDLTLTGSDSANSIFGTSGDDFIDGKGGADQLYGYGGNDRYVVDDANDVVHEAANGGIDTVYAKVSFTLGAGQDIEVLAAYNGAPGLKLTGNAINNSIDGGAGNDILDGGAGNDILDGGAGNDIYYVDNPGDIVIERSGAGRDTVYATGNYTLGSGQEIELLRHLAPASGPDVAVTLIGNAGANAIYGGGGNDSLQGGGGNDILDGGAGNDALAGGAGNDVYYVNGAGDMVSEASGGGTDTIYATGSYTLAAGQEIEVLRHKAPIRGLDFGTTLTGNGFANAIYGGSGNDGLSGDDGNDILSGLGGDDTLVGGSGADAMAGGSGNDTYYVENSGDTVTEAVGGGYDRVLTSVSYKLAAGQEIEVLQLVPPGRGLTIDATLTGNEFANIITGGAGNDGLSGGAGNDVLNGGAGDDALNGGAGNDMLAGGSGNDTYYIDSTADTVTEAVGGGYDTVVSSASYAELAAGQEIEKLVFSEPTRTATIGALLFGNEFDNAIYGSRGDDQLTGRDGNDLLTGNGGNDILEGGNGNDVLVGGDGSDTAAYAQAGAAVIVSLALTGPQDTGGAGIDSFSGIENLSGSLYDDRLTGDSGDNILNGLNGDDVLTGGAGNDILNGYNGNDTASYLGAIAGVTVDLTITTAQDTGGAGVDRLLLIENLRGSSFDDVLTGNAVPNLLNGADGNDMLLGNAGNDNLVGGSGNDTLSGGDGQDRLDGGDGNDLLAGDAGNDTIAGGAGIDSITGGDGNDVLSGDAGRDLLTGGGGADRFVYASLGDSTVTSGGRDQILDFSHADGDHIDLSALDAITGGADDAFKLVTAFDHVAGELIELASNGNWLIEGDVNGDAAADFAILVTSATKLIASDFVL